MKLIAQEKKKKKKDAQKSAQEKDWVVRGKNLHIPLDLINQFPSLSYTHKILCSFLWGCSGACWRE